MADQFALPRVDYLDGLCFSHLLLSIINHNTVISKDAARLEWEPWVWYCSAAFISIELRTRDILLLFIHIAIIVACGPKISSHLSLSHHIRVLIVCVGRYKLGGDCHCHLS